MPDPDGLNNLSSQSSLQLTPCLIMTKNSTDGNRTETISESLNRSMLKYLNLETAKEKDLEEAFCRDIDSFNSAYIVSRILWLVIDEFSDTCLYDAWS